MDVSSFVTTVSASLEAVATVLLVASGGSYMLWRRHITYESTSFISKVVFHLFLPCLLFHEIGANITADNIKTVLPVTAFFLLYLLTCFIVGQVVASLVVNDVILHRPAVIAMTFGNTSYFPLLLLQSVDWRNFTSSPVEAESEGVIYIATMMAFSSVLFWSFAHMYLKNGHSVESDHPALPAAQSSGAPNVDDELDVMEIELEDLHESTLDSKPSTSGLEENSQHPTLERSNDGQIRQISSTPLRDTSSRRSFWIQQTEHIVTPPLVACLFGFLVGVIKPLQDLVFVSSDVDHPVFQIVSATTGTLAGATLPSGMVVIGASVFKGIQDTMGGASPLGPKKFSTKAQIIISGVRLLFLPILGMLIIRGLKAIDAMHVTPMVEVSCGLVAAMPTSPNLVVLTQVADLKEVSPAISRIIFIQYLASAISVAAFLFVQLYISYVHPI